MQWPGRMPTPFRGLMTPWTPSLVSCWFSALDIVNGYWQVEVGEQEREKKTAFCTPYGLYEFNFMPFGWCSGPATFQRLIELMLAGLQMTTAWYILMMWLWWDAPLMSISSMYERCSNEWGELDWSSNPASVCSSDRLGHEVSAKTEKTATFEWTRECQEAFFELHQKLCTAPVLMFPDFTKPFLYTQMPATLELVECYLS